MNEIERRRRIEALVRTLQEDPGSHCYVELVERLIDDQQYRRAQSILQRSRSIDPDHLPGRLLKIRLQTAQGDYTRAIKGIRRILKVRPHDPEAILIYADALDESGESEQAIRLLRKKLRYADDPRFLARLQQLVGDASVHAERTVNRPRFVPPMDSSSARTQGEDTSPSLRAPKTSARKEMLSRPPANPKNVHDEEEEPPTAESAIPITLMHAIYEAQATAKPSDTQQTRKASDTVQSIPSEEGSSLDQSVLDAASARETQPNILKVLESDVREEPNRLTRDEALDETATLHRPRPRSKQGRRLGAEDNFDQQPTIPGYERTTQDDPKRVESLEATAVRRPSKTDVIAVPDKEHTTDVRSIQSQNDAAISPRPISEGKSEIASNGQSSNRSAAPRPRARPPSEPRGLLLPGQMDQKPVDGAAPRTVDLVQGVAEIRRENDRSGGTDTRGRQRTHLNPWIFLLIFGITLASLIVVSSIQYSREVRRIETLILQDRESIIDGNYASRVDLLERLNSPIDPLEDMAGIVRDSLNLVTTSAWDEKIAQRNALRGRILAELVTVYEDGQYREAAREALGEWDDSETDDHRIGHLLMDIDSGHFQRAAERLSGLDIGTEEEGDYAWVAALLAERSGQTETSVKEVRLAVEKAPTHPHAAPLFVRLTSPLKTGRLARLEAYENLLKTPQHAQHIDSLIAYEAVRIELGKQRDQAADRLRDLLQRPSGTLADIQAARVHQSLAYVFEENKDLNSAVTAHRAALKLRPGDVRFALPLARLHLERYELDRAALIMDGVDGEESPQWLLLRSEEARLRGDLESALGALDPLGDEHLKVMLQRANIRLALGRSGQTHTEKQHLEDALTDFNTLRDKPGFTYRAQMGRSLALVRLERQTRDTLRTMKALKDSLPATTLETFSPALPDIMYGKALLAQGQRKKALTQFRIALEFSADDSEVHWELCQLHSESLQTELAMTHCRRALKNEHFLPARTRLSRLAYENQDPATLLEALTPLVKSGRASAQDRLLWLHALYTLGRADELRQSVRMEMQEWGRAERAFARGTLALLDGLDGQVAPHLLEAVNAHPSQSNVLIPYVRFLQRQGQRDEALAKLELAHSMRPSAIVSLEAARVAMALGRYDTAQEMARAARAQAKKGHDPPQIRARAYALEAQALISTGQDADLRAARTPMRRALRMEKNGSETLLAAALYAEHTGKDSLALKRYQRLVRVDPQSAAGFFYFGRLLRRSPEQAKESDSALSKARDLDPNGIWGVRAQQILNARD